MPQDINRKTTNVLLDPEVSAEIWAKTLEESAIMQLARKVDMPGGGKKFQTITGEPVADWVGETESKPVSTHTFGKKTVQPYKLAVIEPFSEEFRRDKAALYSECVRRLPFALAKKFDQTVMGTTAPGADFDVLGDATQVSLVPASSKTVYDQFITVDSAISAADGIMSGIALAPQGKSKVLSAVDNVGHPLFTAGVGSGTVGSILGANVSIAKGIYTQGTPNFIGLAGDFDEAIYGTVEGIKMAVSEETVLKNGDDLIFLWQQNMFAVRFEIEVAFAVKDKAKFVLLTDAE